ncbi:MAG: galactose-1-phosphate uridylyltransferase [Candidatus Doudnabacteria bacterium]
MSEFRQDIVSKHWVLFAPNRASKPEDFKLEPSTPPSDQLPEVDKSCAFCPGNEEKNQEICSVPNGRNWQVRVIPNKFEALGHLGGSSERHDFYRVREGIGDHEVIITRPHNILTGFLTDDILDTSLKVYQDRMVELSNHPEVEYVHVIQNHGHAGGASILHPHSQIFATPFVPEHLHGEVVSSYHSFLASGACIYCEVILKELSDQVRVVLDEKDFFVSSPFAARVPFALRIIPKRHQANFFEMTDGERRSLARVLKLILQKIYFKLKNPAYNFYIHTLPVSHSLHTRYDVRSYHWHLEILPRLNVWGGFELGSDVYVNTILPETAADIYRQP